MHHDMPRAIASLGLDGLFQAREHSSPPHFGRSASRRRQVAFTASPIHHHNQSAPSQLHLFPELNVAAQAADALRHSHCTRARIRCAPLGLAPCLVLRLDVDLVNAVEIDQPNESTWVVVVAPRARSSSSPRFRCSVPS
jgi:hypothetical protein